MAAIERLLTPRVRFAYQSRKQSKSLTSGPGWRACFQLFKVRDGTLAVPKTGLLIRPGQLVLVDPGTEVQSSPEARYGRVVFDLLARSGSSSANEWAPQPPWFSLFGQPSPGVLSPTFTASWDHRIHLIVCARLRDAIEHIQANMTLGLLVAELLSWCRDTKREKQKEMPVSVPAVIIKLENMLRSGLIAGMRIREAAEQLGYDPAYLSRRYREVRGCTIKEFQRHTRIQKACALIKETPDIALAEIAQKLGLQSVRSLHRSFVAELGVGPDAWRRQWRSNDR